MTDGFGIRPGFDEVALTKLLWLLSFEGPGVMPERFAVCNPASSRIVRFVRTPNVGGSLTDVTVRRNASLADAVPSLTVIVIVTA